MWPSLGPLVSSSPGSREAMLVFCKQRERELWTELNVFLTILNRKTMHKKASDAVKTRSRPHIDICQQTTTLFESSTIFCNNDMLHIAHITQYWQASSTRSPPSLPRVPTNITSCTPPQTYLPLLILSTNFRMETSPGQIWGKYFQYQVAPWGLREIKKLQVELSKQRSIQICEQIYDWYLLINVI